MLEGIHKIHLIGIGGSGMRAIANILIQKGYEVSGSDVKESDVIERFRQMGATVHIGHNYQLVITCLADIKFSSKTCSHSCEERTNFFIG